MGARAVNALKMATTTIANQPLYARQLPCRRCDQGKRHHREKYIRPTLEAYNANVRVATASHMEMFLMKGGSHQIPKRQDSTGSAGGGMHISRTSDAPYEAPPGSFYMLVLHRQKIS